MACAPTMPAMTETATGQTGGRIRWAKNRVENSHMSFRRRELSMLRIRRMKTLQKFASFHANVHNHFNFEPSPRRSTNYKPSGAAALPRVGSLRAEPSPQRLNCANRELCDLV